MRMHRKQNPRLARLFEFAMGEPTDWDEEELGDVLRHQLKTSLLADLRPLASEIDALGLVTVSSAMPPPDTFDDLLGHPKPNLALLRLAKDFAKTADNRLEDPLPTAVARALYISIIAAAIVRHAEKISVMSDAELRSGFEWILAREWITEPLRQLARNALAEL